MVLSNGNICLYNELLFSLNGFYGDIYFKNNLSDGLSQTNIEHKSKSIIACSKISNSVDELVKISMLYYEIRNYITLNSTSQDEFIFILCNLIDKILKETYLKLLVQYELCFNHKDLTFQFIELIQFKSVFIDILNIINGINEENKCVAIFKLLDLFNHKYELRFDFETDPLFQGIWSWISRGDLPLNYKNSFFISFNAPQLGAHSSLIDLSKVPNLIDPINAIEIHNIGNIIRYVRNHGISFDFYDSELFWKYFAKRFEMYDVSISLKYFLRDIKSTIFEYIQKRTQLKEKFLLHIHHLKVFYLHGCETFWTIFYELYSKCDDDCEPKILFKNALYLAFNDSDADFYNTSVSIKMDLKKLKNISIMLHLKQPELIKIIISEKSLNRYQAIFVYLQNIQASRRNLLDLWKEGMFTFKKSLPSFCAKKWFLIQCLTKTLSIIYLYAKFSIEHKISNFMRLIQDVVEIDEIQKLHDTCFLDIINNLFIKNTFILNLINRILYLSEKCVNQEMSIDQLIKDYNHTITVFKETLQFNRRQVKMFYELLITL